jgi:hypothetical protein
MYVQRNIETSIVAVKKQEVLHFCLCVRVRARARARACVPAGVLERGLAHMRACVRECL